MKTKYFLALLLPILVLADEVEEKDIGESILNANTLTSNIVASNITKIDSSDIALRPNMKFSDTLRTLSGIRIPKGRGMETFDTITIRGIANGSNIIVDGISLNDMNNNTKMLTAMSALDLDNVEVLRGAFSSLYGSGAIGGVANFTTAMPQQLEAKAHLGYGNPFIADSAAQNLVRGYFSLGDTFLKERLRLKASYGFSTSSGYAADDAWSSSTESGISGYKPSLSPSGETRYIVGDMGRQAYQTHDFRLKAQADITDNSLLDMGINYTNYDYRHKNPTSNLKDASNNTYWGNSSGGSGSLPYAFVGGMGNERNSQVSEFIKYKHLLDSQSLELNFTRLDNFRDYLSPNAGASPFGGSGVKERDDSSSTFANILYDMEFLDNKLGLLIGGDYKFMQMDIKKQNIADWRYYNASNLGFAGSSGGESHFGGILAELRGNLLDSALLLSLGGRLDYWYGGKYYSINADYSSNATATKNEKFAFSPKLGISYKPLDSMALKFSFGQAFRVPTLTQMFSTHTYNDGTTILGNPNLKPESVTSFDLGIEQTTWLNGELKAFYFFSELKDMIYTSGDSTTRRIQNAGKGRIQGLELSYNQPLPLGFNIYASYTFTHSKMLKNDIERDSIGKYIPNIPLHMGYVELSYQGYGFLASIGGEFMSKPYANANNSDTISHVYGATDGYALLNIKLGYEINKYLSIALDITNALNYQYYSYYKAPGAAFYASFSAKY